MQQTLNVSWWRRARLDGIFRYHWKTLSRTVGWVLLIILAAQAIAFLAPLVFNVNYTFSGVYADVGLTLMLAFVCGVTVAHRGTRFLLRFGTARFPVWLGNVLALLAAMTVFLLGTLLMSILMGWLTLAMANVMPNKYLYREIFGDDKGMALLGRSLKNAIAGLPTNILYALEWTSILYMLGCFVRRNRILAISLVVGVPLLMMILMLIPAVRETARVLENANEGQVFLLGVQWMKILMDVMTFIKNEWQTIQLVGAVASLPISYLFMRSTPQP